MKIARLYIITVWAVLWLLPQGTSAQEGLVIDTVQERRIAHRLMVGFPAGEFAEERQVGFSVRYAALYALSNKQRVGLGIGVDQFLPEGYPYLPLTLEWQGQTGAYRGFVYNLSAGYAFPMYGDPDSGFNEVLEGEGGLSGQLMAGYLFTVNDRFRFMAGLAFHYQKASIYWEEWTVQTAQEMTFRRLGLNIGMTF